MASIWDDIGSIFEAPVTAIEDVVSFLQWISWLFNPINWLRMVEFLTGASLFYMGMRRVINQRIPSVGSQVRHIVRRVPGIGTASRVIPERDDGDSDGDSE